MPEPNRAEAEGCMRFARKAGRAVADYISDTTLRQRLLADQPMSTEEWDEVSEILRTHPERLYLRPDRPGRVT